MYPPTSNRTPGADTAPGRRLGARDVRMAIGAIAALFVVMGLVIGIARPAQAGPDDALAQLLIDDMTLPADLPDVGSYEQVKYYDWYGQGRSTDAIDPEA